MGGTYVLLVNSGAEVNSALTGALTALGCPGHSTMQGTRSSQWVNGAYPSIFCSYLCQEGDVEDNTVEAQADKGSNSQPWVAPGRHGEQGVVLAQCIVGVEHLNCH